MITIIAMITASAIVVIAASSSNNILPFEDSDYDNAERITFDQPIRFVREVSLPMIVAAIEVPEEPPVESSVRSVPILDVPLSETTIDDALEEEPATEEEVIDSLEESEQEDIPDNSVGVATFEPTTVRRTVEESSPDAEMNFPPIYLVYKNGMNIRVTGKLQHYIRELMETHGYWENLTYGMILVESTFNPGSIGGWICDLHTRAEECDHDCCANGTCNLKGRYFGLSQMSAYWLRSPALAEYRLTDDYRSRDLLNPYDNLLTMIESWNYARDKYELDTSTELGMIRILFWHNTGQNPNHVTLEGYPGWWYRDYASKVYRFAGELLVIGYGTSDNDNMEVEPMNDELSLKLM